MFFLWCFQSNDLIHEFKKLTRVDILFLFFYFHYSTLVFFKKISFVVFLIYFLLGYLFLITWYTSLIGQCWLYIYCQGYMFIMQLGLTCINFLSYFYPFIFNWLKIEHYFSALGIFFSQVILVSLFFKKNFSPFIIVAFFFPSD